MNDKIKILIAYSSEERITHSFWKYFFQVCGVWVKSYLITKDSLRSEPGYKSVYILNRNDINRINDVPLDAICIVQGNSSFQAYRKHQNVCVFKWRNYGTYYGILDKIFWKNSIFHQLLTIFIDNNLWIDAWLFHEVAHIRDNCWDEFICMDCKKTMTLLNNIMDTYQGNEAFYIKYMMLYCRFLELGVQRIIIINMGELNQNLLNSIKKVAAQEGWNLPLLVLAAQTSALSSITIMQSMYYLFKTQEIENNGGLLYDIGEQYRVLLGDEENAYYFFQKAVAYDPTYYRAIYKIARYMERNRKWIQALTNYKYILDILPNVLTGNYASVSEIEYIYKSCRNLEEIFRERLIEPKFAELYKTKREQLKMNLKKNGFAKLTHCMSLANKTANVAEIFAYVTKEIISRL